MAVLRGAWGTQAAQQDKSEADHTTPHHTTPIRNLKIAFDHNTIQKIQQQYLFKNIFLQNQQKKNLETCGGINFNKYKYSENCLNKIN